MTAEPVKILLIDDNEIDVKVVRKLLENGYGEPFELRVCNKLEKGNTILEKESPDVVLLDLHLPDSDTDQTIAFVSYYEDDFPFIILSSIHDKQLRIRAIQNGAQDYLVKNDFDSPLLARVLNYSIERHRLHKELHLYAKELKDKEQRLIEAQAIAQIGNWELLLDNNTIEWSREARNILEIDNSQVFTAVEWFGSLLNPEEKKSVWKIFRQAIEESTDFNEDFSVNLPNNKIKYLNLRVRSTQVDNEYKKRVRGTIQDVTARKQMEEALKSSEERYHRLFEESSDAIWITSDDGKFIDFNSATVDMLGYTPEELYETPVTKLYLNPYDLQRVRKAILQKGSIRDYEVVFRKKDGTKIDCLVNASRWRSNDGETIGFQGIIRDITEKKRNEELIRNKEIAERSSRLKQRFLANMSHEIRTPITSIAGLAHLILKTNLDPQQQQYLEGIKTSSDHLLALVNDILDFSKIEEGKIKFHVIEFSLEEHLVQLVKTMEFTAMNKGIELLIDYDHRIPAKFYGDPIRLNQIIFNLLSNAIKFTDQGYVKLTARLIEDGKHAAVVSLTVQDTGIGIPENKLGTIFRSFTQLGKDVTKTAEGTGLGLTITRQLVELQGGSISVKSKVNEGSNFEVVMMFKKLSENGLDKPPNKKEEKREMKENTDIGYKKILIVDDKKLNQLVTSEMLKSWWKNIEFEVADDGKQAVEKLREKEFDLVLMDVQMPVMDGYEATKAIRNELKIAYSVMPILAVTAYNTEAETQKCLEAGMNDFVSKPYDPEELHQKIIGLLHRGALQRPESSGDGRKQSQREEGDELNLSYLDMIAGANAELKSKIIQLLIDETPDEIYNLKLFSREKNWKRVRAVAHKMKSGVTYLGLAKAKERIKRIEEYAAAETHLDRIPDLVEKVSVACTKAINDLVKTRNDRQKENSTAKI